MVKGDRKVTVEKNVQWPVNIEQSEKVFILFLDMGIVLRQGQHMHFMQHENKQT